MNMAVHESLLGLRRPLIGKILVQPDNKAYYLNNLSGWTSIRNFVHSRPKVEILKFTVPCQNDIGIR